MLNAELWALGGTTMVVGMGIVFSFLVILIISMIIMTKCVEIINKICPVPVEAPKTKAKTATDDSEIALAIAVAALNDKA